MALKLNGSTDGSVSLDAPADTSPSGSDISFTLPTADGLSGQVIQTNGSGVLSFVNQTTDTNTQITRGTAATLSDDSSASSATHLAGQKTPISGPRGTLLKFTIGASLELQTNTYLFDLIGLATNPTPMGVECRAIDTTIRVTGVTTGTSIDIPVRYIKKV